MSRVCSSVMHRSMFTAYSKGELVERENTALVKANQEIKKFYQILVQFSRIVILATVTLFVTNERGYCDDGHLTHDARIARALVAR